MPYCFRDFYRLHVTLHGVQFNIFNVLDDMFVVSHMIVGMMHVLVMALKLALSVVQDGGHRVFLI